MLFPRYQAEAYISGPGNDNHLWRICERMSTGRGQKDFKLLVESAHEFEVVLGERLYVTEWLTYDQLQGGKYRLRRHAPTRPQLPVAA